jgi:hypothetical protein
MPRARDEAVGPGACEPRHGLRACWLRGVEVALEGHATSVGPQFTGLATADILGWR